MNIAHEIRKEHSRRQMLRIVDFIGTDKTRFSELMQLFFTNEYRISQRASWPVSYCAEKHPELITPYLELLLDNLRNPIHNAVKRNTVRILQNIQLPESLLGKAVDVCFTFLMSKTEPVAIKVFSMAVLANIAQREPGIKSELRAIIEDQLPYALPAFVSRGRKILKIL